MKLQLSKCGKAAFSMVLPFCSAQGKDLFYLKIHWDKDPIKSFFPIPNEREIRAMQENEPKKSSIPSALEELLLENRKPLKIGLIKCVGPFYENEDPEGNFSIFMVREEMVSTRSLSVHHVHSVSGSTE